MDRQLGQFQVPQDSDPNQGQPQQPTDGIDNQAPLPPVQVTPSAMPSQQATDAGTQNATQGQQSAFPATDVSPQAQDLAQEVDWRYNQGSDSSNVEPLPDDMSWSAAEFVEHPKNASWYSLLILAAIVLSGVDYYVTKDLFSAIIIVVAAAMFGVYAGHKPRTQKYHLSPDGLQIGHKTYTFQTFKAFSVLEEGSTASIMFTPLARFAPPLTIYVNSDIEDKVLDYLSLFLPFEQRRADAVDGLLRRIRF